MSTFWYLEGFEGRSQKILRAAIREFPFSVGRRSSCDLSLNSKMVSQLHAELFEHDRILRVRDNGSTNGTFVNGQRVTSENDLKDGDILHFADLEFKVVRSVAESSWPSLTKTVNLKDGDLPGGGIGRYRELRAMLQEKALRAMYQPLVRLSDGELLGFEALGRGTLEGAPTSPGELFGTAESIGLATELSVAFRDKGIEEASQLVDPSKIFLNTHPHELADQDALLKSLEPLLAQQLSFDIVLEIHESAVTDGAALKGLRQELDKLGVGIAFDDFGTGQARLVELTDAAPQFLKFDAVFIKNIHLASKQRQDMVRTLVKMVVDLGIASIAEGVEQAEEAEVCSQLGFEYGQGYYFGRPAPASRFANAAYKTDVP